jgi:hypothetical protein
VPSTCVCWESFVREIIASVVNDLLGRFDALRYRWAQSRFWRADRGIAVVLLIGALLGFGVLAATAVTGPSADTVWVAQSNAARASSFPRTEVVTQTVKRHGRVVRVVRHHLATTAEELITLPGQTVRVTQTVTRREVATVTVVQPVTVTVSETVTCKPKDC